MSIPAMQTQALFIVPPQYEIDLVVRTGVRPLDSKVNLFIKEDA
jgi:hypothetical protein